VKAKLSYKPPFYFQEGDSVPFCPRCYEKETIAVHLFAGVNREDLVRWDCPECKQHSSDTLTRTLPISLNVQ